MKPHTKALLEITWKVIVPFFIGAMLMTMAFRCAEVAHAHYEDPVGCEILLMRWHADAVLIAEGVSEDQRDYTKTYLSVSNPDNRVEVHYALLPRSEWKDNLPTFALGMPISAWSHWDNARRRYLHFWINPRQTKDCADFLHLQWDDKIQDYRLVHHTLEKKI